MKRLITFFIGIIIIGTLSAQQSNIFKYPIHANGGIVLPSGNLQTHLDSLKNSLAGIYNVLDYGAIENDGLADQVAFQAAINAAYNYGLTSPQFGGTVIIPAGTWNISAPDTLKSYVNIQIDKNAMFVIVPNYDKSVWYGDGLLKYCRVDGGYYYSTGTRTWNYIELQSTLTSKGVVFNYFSDMVVQNPNIGIKLTCTSTGWINGNVFNNIIILNPIIGIKPRRAGTSQGLDGNSFTNIHIQAVAGVTTFGIDSLGGSYNSFHNFFCWDFTDDWAVQKTVVLTNTSHYNTFTGGAWLSDTHKFLDNGTYNFAQIGTYQLSKSVSDSMVINGQQLTNGDLLTLTKKGTAGTAGHPGGSTAIKLVSYNSGFNGANGAAKIESKNEASSGNGSWLYLLTHGNTASTNYTKSLVIDPLGNSRTKGAINYVVDNSVGGNDTYTATIDTTAYQPFGYVTGKVIIFHPLTANTGACTLNINGDYAYSIKTQANGDPANSDMVSTGWYPLCWAASYWVLITK